MLVQRPRLVVGSFEDGGASHRGLGGGNDGEILARNSQQNLPGECVSQGVRPMTIKCAYIVTGAWCCGRSREVVMMERRGCLGVVLPLAPG